MSELKATPGPWYVLKCEPGCRPQIVAERGLMVAMCAHNIRDHSEVAAANSRLISSCHDLYDALSAVEKLLPPTPSSLDGGYMISLSQEKAGDIIAALAKARGE